MRPGEQQKVSLAGKGTPIIPLQKIRTLGKICPAGGQIACF